MNSCDECDYKGLNTRFCVIAKIIFKIFMDDLKQLISDGEKWFQRYIQTLKTYATKLKKSKEFLSTTLNSIGDGVIATDDKGIITFINPIAENLTFWEKTQAKGKPSEQVFHVIKEGTRKVIRNPISRVLQEKVVLRRANHTILITKNKREIPIAYNAAPITDDVDAIIGVVLIFRDITSEKIAEEALKKSEASLANAQRIAHVGNWDWDIINNELYWSDEIYRIFNISQRDFQENYDAFLSFIHPNDREFVELSVNNALFKKMPYDIDHRIVLSDGSIRVVHEQAEVTFDEFGTPLRMVGTVQDITKYKQMEKKIKKSEKKYMEAYERAEFYKDLFAHDITNILQVILSGIDIGEALLMQNDLESLNDIFNMIKEQVFKGAQLVSNVRKFSQLDTNKIQIMDINLYELMKKCVNSFISLKPYRKLNIKIKTSNKGILVKADDLLQDVIDNLLTNAVRHNENPQVDIKINISRNKREKNDYIRIEVIDNGVGVEDDRKQIIFSREPTNKNISGMGLGLSLVRKIIKSYRGKIWVEDRVKGDHTLGSVFILLLPEATQMINNYIIS